MKIGSNMSAPRHSDAHFGKSVGSMLLVFSIVLYFLNRSLVLYFLVPGLLMLGLAFFFPFVLKPVNKLWMLLGKLLHTVVSPIILGIVYFVLIVPIGLIRRMFNKNMISNAGFRTGTYWKAPEKPVNFNKQF